MKIYIGHMDKRLNSTKHKQTGEWTTKGSIEVKLKEPTTIDKPVFLLQRVVYDKNGNVIYALKPSDNWIYVPTWGYYWIDQTIMSTNELVTFVCHRDVLASGTDYLKKCEAYLSYCSDKKIAVDYQTMDDPRLGPDKYIGAQTTGLSDTEGGEDTPDDDEDGEWTMLGKWFVDDASKGTVVVSLVGTSAGCLQWFMSPYQYYQLLQAAASGAGVSTMDVMCSKFLGTDWRACLNYAIYMPVSLEKVNKYFPDSDSTILWGSVTCSLGDAIHYTLAPFAAASHTSVRTIAFPTLAGKSDYAFLRGPKYSSVFFETSSGSQEISSEAFTLDQKVLIQEVIDLINGDYTIKVYSNNYSRAGVPLGSVTEHLGVDVTGSSKMLPNPTEAVAGVLKAAAKVGVVAAGAMMTAGGAAVAAGDSAGAAMGAGFGMKGAASYELANYGKMAMSSANGIGMASGVIGAFSGGGASPVGQAHVHGGGITAYFTSDYLKNLDARANFRFVVSTSAPALIADEAQTGDPVELPKFAKLHGYPCNKWTALSKVAEGSYIECVKLSAVSTSDKDYKPEMPKFTLTPAELGELNNLLNTGVYLEDWET